MPLVRKIAMLKRNCFSAVFEKYFEFQKKRDVPVGERKRAVIHYRENESLYVDASSDRVIVIFATVFVDADDKVIGRVFMDVKPFGSKIFVDAFDFISFRFFVNNVENFNKHLKSLSVMENYRMN